MIVQLSSPTYHVWWLRRCAKLQTHSTPCYDMFGGKIDLLSLGVMDLEPIEALHELYSTITHSQEIQEWKGTQTSLFDLVTA